MGLGIKTFEIKGLFNRFDVKIPLDNDVNIFLGENGLGKTTILNCFYCVLKPDFEKLVNIKFKKIILTFIDSDSLDLSYEDLNCYIEKNNDSNNSFSIIDNFQELIQENIKYDNDKKRIENVKKFKETIKKKITDDILFFPTYRRIEKHNLITNKIKDHRYRYKYYKYYGEYTDKLIKFGMDDVNFEIKELLEKIKSKSIGSFRKMTARLITQYLDQSNLDELSNSKFKIDTNKLEIALARIGTEIESNDKEQIKQLVSNGKIYENNVYLLNLIKNLIDSYNEQKVYDEKIKGFVDVCNKYLRGKQFVYNESTVELDIITDDKSIIEMENLSSGEKQIVSTFSKLYIEKKKDCIVIFDEPELSLSISWQENFLPDVMNSPKCKFILAATHSPFIFSNEFRQLANDMGECVSPMDKENL